MLKSEIIANCLKYADKIAFTDRNFQISYREVLEVIAHNIKTLTFAQGNVGILTDHCVEGVLSELICLFSDQTFVPIDASIPEKRIDKIIDSSSVVTIIIATDNDNLFKKIQQRFPNINFVSLCLDVKSQTDLESAARELIVRGDENEEMYHLYTSGTTGNPKAVVQTREAVLYFVGQYKKNIGIRASDHLTLFSTLGHDASIIDIYSSLVSGATLHLLDLKQVKNFLALKKWIIKNKISIWHSVPTVFRAAVRFNNQTFSYSPRLIVLGGEEVLKADFYKVKEHFSNTKLYVLYGQTEHSYTSGILVAHEEEVGMLGEPIEGVDLAFESRENDTQEVVIHSPYLFKYYIINGEKKYKDFEGSFESGDLVSLSDTGYRFRGRKDRQIKINGNRVDLAEIESIVEKEFDDIDFAVLENKNLKMNATNLVGVIYGTDHTLMEINILLQRHLPSYELLTSLIEVTKEFPKTATGKRDLLKLSREVLL